MGVKLLLWSVAPGPPAAVAPVGITATGMVMVRLLLRPPMILRACVRAPRQTDWPGLGWLLRLLVLD